MFLGILDTNLEAYLDENKDESRLTRVESEKGLEENWLWGVWGRGLEMIKGSNGRRGGL